jgi:hypothetical protein
MFGQFLLATVMVVITLLMHGAGIAGLARAFRFEPSGVVAHHHFSLRNAFMISTITYAGIGFDDADVAR